MSSITMRMFQGMVDVGDEAQHAYNKDQDKGKCDPVRTNKFHSVVN